MDLDAPGSSGRRLRSHKHAQRGGGPKEAVGILPKQ